MQGGHPHEPDGCGGSVRGSSHRFTMARASLVRLCHPAGRLLLQSDVEEAAAAMRDQFERHGSAAFELAPEHATQHVFFSPSPSTAREQQEQQQGAVATSSSNGNGNGQGNGNGNGSGVGHEQVELPTGGAVGAASNGKEQGQGHASASLGVHQHRQQQGRGGLDLGEPAGSLTDLAATLIAAANSKDGWAAALAAAASEHNGGAAPLGAAVGAHGVPGAAPSGGMEERARADSHGDSAGSRSGSEEGSDGEGYGDGAESGTGEEDGEGEGEVEGEQLVWAQGGWLVDNPVGTPTEREHYVLQQGLPVFRVLLARK